MSTWFTGRWLPLWVSAWTWKLKGNMIVDIGGGTTEIAVILWEVSLPISLTVLPGDDLTDDIQEIHEHQHNIKIGERTAEEIKIHVGSALSNWMNLLPTSWCKDRIR